MGNRQYLSNQMRQLYDEMKDSMSAPERLEFLLKIGKQQAQEQKNRKLTHKIGREKKKDKTSKPSGGIINPGVARFLESKKGDL